MAAMNAQLRHELDQASTYRQKLKARDGLINQQLVSASNFVSAQGQNPYDAFFRGMITALASGKYQKPSEFCKNEKPWLFEHVVYPRFRTAFLTMADQVLDYSYAVSIVRRSCRSKNYASYIGKLTSMTLSFWQRGNIDADICDILTGNLPEEVLCYLRHHEWRPSGFAAEVLAYELDQNNPRLEAIVTDIINGEDSFATVSHDLIQGIVMSHNSRMHQLLCRLLLAARLQEGLRQSICENADQGTKEAFLAIVSTIAENGLIRYSAVKRAVGTWLGLISGEAGDLNRVSEKSAELICRCLSDRSFRDTCLHSEDAMKIYIALWSCAFDSVEEAMGILDEISVSGTHHQLLTAGYFVHNLDNDLLRHSSAKAVLRRHRDKADILAVYLPQFIPHHSGLAQAIVTKQPYENAKYYFDTNEEATELCDWMISVHRSMGKRELVFDPCIFPWYKAVLKKSDLVEKAMVIAAAMQDQSRIDALCPMLADCGAIGRETFFKAVTMGEKTPAVRAAIIKALADKAESTRWAAYQRCDEMKLTGEEYLQIEDLLRLRYDDLRKNIIALLMKQPGEAMEAAIGRLLRAPKTEKRIAALDMLLQLQKEKTELAQRCIELVRTIPKPTTQEKVLIEALLSKQNAAKAQPLFTEADRYQPVIEIDDYARECLREFTAFFPDSKLEQQVLEGIPTAPQNRLSQDKPCRLVLAAKERLQDLSEFFVHHETEHFDTGTGYGDTRPISADEMVFLTRDPETNQFVVPRMDLWNQWFQDRKVTVQELMGMFVLLSAQNADVLYLQQCANYIADLFGSGFETPVAYRYMGHMHRVLQALLNQELSEEALAHTASAIGLWIARCLPDEMLIGDRGLPITQSAKGQDNRLTFYYADPVMRMNHEIHEALKQNPAGHFIAHPQIAYFLFWLKPLPGEIRKHFVPLAVDIFERTFASTEKYVERRLGKTISNRQTLILHDLYSSVDMRFQRYIFPDASTYLYARHYGLISEQTLYYHLTQPTMMREALRRVTSICALCPTDGKTVSLRYFTGYRSSMTHSSIETFFGKGPEAAREKPQLLALCHEVAERLTGLAVEAELRRGDYPAAYSAHISGIECLFGAKNFVRILCALGKDTLDRNIYYYWHSDDTRRGNLSHLLNRCSPAPGDSAETLRALLQGTDITKKRLIEAAMFSPEWIDIIGEYLDLPGFKSACYYFMAHMNEEFDELKKAAIARYSPLSAEELNQGAFDVQWFHAAFNQLGEQTFDLLYDAAKYISNGNRHTRARKYADAALGRLDIDAAEAAIREKRNKDLLMAYTIIPLAGEEDLTRRYLFLQQFLKESRRFGAQRIAGEKIAVEMAMRNLATNAGISDTMRLTLQMEARLMEDNLMLFTEQQVEEWHFCLQVDDRGTIEVQCRRGEKALKAIPSKAKKHPYVLRLMEMKKQFTEQYRRTRLMLEQAMEDSTRFTLKELRQLDKNPVVRPMISKLVFRCSGALGLFDGEHLTDPDGTVLCAEEDAQVTVAHPVRLYQSGKWLCFQQYIFDHKIVQPFKQVFRELYVKTGDELGCDRSRRYDGNQIQPKKAAACLRQRRWVVDIEAGLQKVYYQENIVATVFALADWFTPADIEAPTLEYVAFFHRKTGEPIKIDDIPDVIFSEVMRDVDLAVSVAHAGGVDPETSHSTVEMRAAILALTLPLLRLENVELHGAHAIIQGKLAKYSVHLGSGIVHQIGGAMLSVLPVHSQHRGRIFLPFVDEDPKTAEIISKVILFSEDDKLKDPSILSQIHR